MSCSRTRAMQVLVMGAVAMGAPVLLGAAGAAGASSPSVAAGSAARLAVGSAPRLPLGARFGPALPAARRLRLTVALRPRDPARLEAFATAVSTPGTPQYGRYLTVPQFARQFGAGTPQIAAVSAALRAGGLHVGAPTANRLTLPVSGTVAQVQRAFSVTEAQVRLPGGRVTFANDRAPRLAAGISRSVQAVLGLDGVARQQPQGLSRVVRSGHRVASVRPHAVGSGPAPCPAAVSAASGGGYTADEIAGAYGIGNYYPSDEGAGQTIALVEFEAYDPNDIAAYQQCYGTSTAVTNVDVDGGPGAFNGNDDESALDLDQVVGLAPQAHIVVYQAPQDDSQAAVLNAIASQDVATVVSSSWGMCESLTGLPTISAENTILEEMAVQGQSFFNSSGDSGSTMCYQTPVGGGPDTSLSVIDPGSQPFATGVGGTFLGNPDGTTPADGSYAGEAVWNDGGADAAGDPASGTGGGVSLAWTMPTYQSSAAAGLGVVQADSGQACGAQLCRQVPDVSADGDPMSGYVVWLTDSSGSGWAVAGGTSASAPLWAAFTALANASPVCRGLTLGFENPALYAIAGTRLRGQLPRCDGAEPLHRCDRGRQQPRHQRHLVGLARQPGQPGRSLPGAPRLRHGHGPGLADRQRAGQLAVRRARAGLHGEPRPPGRPADGQGPRGEPGAPRHRLRRRRAHLQRHRPAGRVEPQRHHRRHLRHADNAADGDGHRPRRGSRSPTPARRRSHGPWSCRAPRSWARRGASAVCAGAGRS